MRLNPQGYPVRGDRLIHLRIAESVYGGPLPKGAEVHHWNGQRDDNRHENLCICQSKQYHSMLHMRAAALDACGHADWLKCEYCQQYDDPKNLTQHRHRHPACHAASNLKRYYAKKARA